MFFKDMDIDIDYNTIMKNRVPLLTTNENWIELFGLVDDKNIVNNKKELERLLDEQKNIDRELRKLKLEKKKIMEKIIETSHKVNTCNDNKSLELLEECQDRLIKINGEIDELTYRSEMLPKEIRTANFILLKETVKYAYKELRSRHETLNTINSNIESLRNELKELISEKHDCEEKINETYSFLHGILGSKEMEKLDKDFLK